MGSRMDDLRERWVSYLNQDIGSNSYENKNISLSEDAVIENPVCKGVLSKLGILVGDLRRVYYFSGEVIFYGLGISICVFKDTVRYIEIIATKAVRENIGEMLRETNGYRLSSNKTSLLIALI